MNSKIKIGILGCANIAIRSVIPAIIELNEDFILAGIASRNKEKLEDCSSKFKTIPYYSYEDLISNSGIDAVYIPLPNALHAEWIEKVLNNNIHVLVEKSMACNLEDVDRLNNLAKQKSLALIENFQFRFHPQLQKIKDLIQNRVIGDLRSVRSSFGFPPFSDKNNIRYQKELGGGALLDAGSYPIKISQILLGLEVEVKAANLKVDASKNIDIWGGAYLQQKNGTLFSQIAFGFDNYYQCNVEIWGSKGKITANRIFTAPSGYEAEVILETNTDKEIIKVPESDHFINMLKHFSVAVSDETILNDEYKQNVNQARLINELQIVAKIK